MVNMAEASWTDVEHWATTMEKPGCEGGFSGSRTDFEAERDNLVQGEPAMIPTQSHWDKAKTWLKGIRDMARRVPCWKAFPSWSVPGELLRGFF